MGWLGHTTPQPPQLLGSATTFVQVDPASPQQASGAGQVQPETHVPLTQLPPGPQLAPHLPQLLGSVSRFASQPFAALPSQLAKPGEQTKPHCPEVQAADAFGGVPQTTPQLPQLRGSTPVLAHPLAQHASPGGHGPPPLQLGAVHTPPTHASPAGQALPHAPQFATLARFASQPLNALPSQSANPGAQTNPHRPEVHAALAFAGLAHTMPQLPQFRTSLTTFAQALAQHACPTAHGKLPLQPGVGVHEPPTHCVPATHFLPQPPQLPGSFIGSTHALPQLVSPGRQPLLLHWPLRQVCPGWQWTPHPPQWLTSDVSSTQAGSQHESPDGQAPPVPQCMAHWPLMHV